MKMHQYFAEARVIASATSLGIFVGALLCFTADAAAQEPVDESQEEDPRITPLKKKLEQIQKWKDGGARERDSANACKKSAESVSEIRDDATGELTQLCGPSAPSAPNPSAPNPSAPNPSAPNPSAPNPSAPNSSAPPRPAYCDQVQNAINKDNVDEALELVPNDATDLRVALERLSLAIEIQGVEPEAVSDKDRRAEFAVAQQCGEQSVFCLDQSGDPFEGDALPKTVRAGQEITVKVIVPADHGGSFSLNLSEIKRLDVIVEAPPKKDRTEESDPGSACAELAPEAFKVAKSESFEVPKALGASGVSVEFSNDKDDKARYEAIIDHGKYYIDLGLLMPFTVNGKRNITYRSVGDERYVAVENDLRVTVGIAMNVFPAGRRRGELTPWSNRPNCGGVTKKKGRCRWNNFAGGPWGELMGFQIGADLDVRDPIDQWYFGLVLEPVTGLTISTGAAILKMDHLKPGIYPGQLVSADADLEPRSRYEARFFGSFGLSLDIVQAVRALRDRLEKEKL